MLTRMPAAMLAALISLSATGGVVEIIVGWEVDDGEIPSVETAVLIANAIPEPTPVTIKIKTIGGPWPGSPIVTRPITLTKLDDAAVRPRVTGRWIFKPGAAGSKVDNVRFRADTDTTPRLTAQCDLTIDDCLFHGQSASADNSEGGGLHIDGNLEITGCEFREFDISGSGGGVQLASGSAVFEDCVFTDNSAGDGGAVAVLNGGATFLNCDFSDNSATSTGGAVLMNTGALSISGGSISTCSAQYGGALGGTGGTATILTGTTTTSNTATIGGSLIWFDGDARVTVSEADCSYTSVSGDGAAIRIAGSSVDILNGMYTINSARDGGALWLDVTEASTVSNCVFTGCTATDNGGAVRARGPVAVSYDVIAESFTAGTRGGFAWLADGASITAPGFENCTASSGGAIFLSGSGCLVSGVGTMLFDDNSAQFGAAIGCEGAGHVISNVECRNGSAWSAGGGIWSAASNTTLSESLVHQNLSAQGGGVACGGGGMTLQNCQIRDNFASLGAGVYAAATTLVVHGGSITSNSGNYGGGVYAADACDVKINDCTVSHNEAIDGGGLSLSNSDVLITNCDVHHNEVSNAAGGAAIASCSGTAQDSTFRDHIVPTHAGGVRLTNSQFLVLDCVVRDNTALEYGGGIVWVDGDTVLQGGEIRANHTPGSGGGIRGAGGVATIDGVHIVLNSASLDGGGAAVEGGAMTSVESIFENNLARNGGGLHVLGSECLVRATTFIANQAQQSGGGVFAQSTTSLECDDDTWMTENTAVWRGGGLCAVGASVSCDGAHFEFGEANLGGGIALDDTTLLATNLRVEANQGYSGGGGIMAEPGSALTLLDASVSFNWTLDSETLDLDGGGMNLADDVPLTADRLRVANNSADAAGGGIFGGSDLKIANSVITGNVSPLFAGIRTDGVLDLDASTVADNTGSLYGTGTVTNCIVWNNGGHMEWFDVTYSCVEYPYEGEGNFWGDPMFTSSGYTLSEESPVINLGNASLLPEDRLDADGDGDVDEATPLDRAGITRVLGPDLDMGAFEWIEGDGEPCPEDIDDSGGITIADLLALLAAWGPCTDCPADIDGDGFVGIDDLLALIAAWGPC